jgi:hypothetical protein
MFRKIKKTRTELIEQRNEVRLAMAKAMSAKDMKEYDRLNSHLLWLDKKIKRRKNET